jgi:hypothetical protein
MARPRKYASNAARQRAYELRKKKAGQVRHGVRRGWFRKAALNVGSKAPHVSTTYHCVKCNRNYRTWRGVRFIVPCDRCLRAWNALLAKRGEAMSRGEFLAGAPHGAGRLVLKDFNAGFLVAENAQQASLLKRGPTNTDNFGGGHREQYDKANESEFQGKTIKAGVYHRSR